MQRMQDTEERETTSNSMNSSRAARGTTVMW